jgi:hypothetical protein
MSSCDFIGLITKVVIDELNNPEIKKKILEPLLVWLLWHIIPYVLLIIGLNFFLTIAAMCLVLYFRR